MRCSRNSTLAIFDMPSWLRRAATDFAVAMIRSSRHPLRNHASMRKAAPHQLGGIKRISWPQMAARVSESLFAWSLIFLLISISAGTVSAIARARARSPFQSCILCILSTVNNESFHLVFLNAFHLVFQSELVTSFFVRSSIACFCCCANALSPMWRSQSVTNSVSREVFRGLSCLLFHDCGGRYWYFL